MLKERTVIPPALICTVHVEVLFVLVDLHGHPDAILATEAVVTSKDLLGFRVLATGVEPTWAFWKKPSQEQDQGGEEDLHPDRYGPAHVAGEAYRTTCDTSSKERADEPDGKLAPIAGLCLRSSYSHQSFNLAASGAQTNSDYLPKYKTL